MGRLFRLDFRFFLSPPLIFLNFLFSAHGAVANRRSTAFSGLASRLIGAYSAARAPPSAAANSVFTGFSAACAGFCTSPAAGVGTWKRDSAHTDKAGDTQSGEKFFQFLFVHHTPLKFRLFVDMPLNLSIR